MSDVEDFLAHYGVKGMKWGRRKARSSSVTPSKDYRDSRLIRGKKVPEMTNAELKALNARLELEQKHRKLNPSKAASGKAWLTSAIATAGLGISIYNLANHNATKAGFGFIKNVVASAARFATSSGGKAAANAALKAIER
jgi:hypothetical protein